MINLIMALVIVLQPPSQGCGDGQNCQGVPWAPVALPALASPTPFATMMATPTQASGAVLPTATGVALGDFNAQLATLQALMDQTAEPLNEFLPTPNAENMSANSATFINYVAGLPSMHFGSMQPLFIFMFGTIGLGITTSIVIIMLPLIVKTVGFFRKIIQLVLDFIPG